MAVAPVEGVVVGGSLETGVKVKMVRGTSEDVSVGGLFVAEGLKRRYLLLVTNIAHMDEELASRLAAVNGAKNYIEYLRSNTLRTVFSAVVVGQEEDGLVEGAKTIPDYLSRVRKASEKEVALFYGEFKPEEEEQGLKMIIGTPIGAEGLIPIDPGSLVLTSFAIYGKSGTGKTVLGNMIALAIAVRSYASRLGLIGEPPTQLLILDMHSEYGYYVRDKYGNPMERGFAGIVGNDSVVYTPDEEFIEELEEMHGRGMVKPLKIYAGSIEPEDLLLMSRMFGLTEYQQTVLWSIAARIRQAVEKGVRGLAGPRLEKKPWITCLYDEELLEALIKTKEFEDREIPTLRSLHRKFRMLSRYGFLEEVEGYDSIGEIVEELVSPTGRRHIVVSFGKYGNDALAYMLITNMIARRLWEEAERRLGEGFGKRIVIYVEEAHKFLDPRLRENSPMGRIARELRKRGVVLCIVDQTPSQIDPDVRGMTWNVFTSMLGDDRDIEASSINLPQSRLFKPILRTLDKQHFLAFGSVYRFPVVFRTVDYREYVARVSRILNKLKARKLKEEMDISDEL